MEAEAICYFSECSHASPSLAVMTGATTAILDCEVTLTMEALHGGAMRFPTTWNIIPELGWPLQT